MIIDHIKRNHFDPWNFAGEDDICSFCGKHDVLTKEHVIPKWCFQNDPDRCFETIINGTIQTFIKTTIPACATCNNDTLSKIERHINNLLQNTDLNTDYYDYEESINIIRWLEIIEYKFHVLNFRRKFIRKQSEDFIPMLRDIPMSVMRLNIEMSPYKALSQLRKSQARIIRKEKDSRYYPLVFWKSKNKQSLFFQNMDEYIFLEFPEYQMAMFYFFNKEFVSNYDAEKEAKQIIIKNYAQNESSIDNG
ncbi:hypothetical protein GXP67_27640 [Rhodocytophaga rosea]|uniref:HNH endonuclease n=1 Tax=Rhodocytophaga rosea TaxID=2704465 RepID=A0A6C0GRN6_9BACT|nr:hypothetical protein [Rhodocytophaga rosea]QHT70150.1 hypothetical protein GXP67_27640 [Rhodocytophaga rosea]